MLISNKYNSKWWRSGWGGRQMMGLNRNTSEWNNWGVGSQVYALVLHLEHNYILVTIMYMIKMFEPLTQLAIIINSDNDNSYHLSGDR